MTSKPPDRSYKRSWRNLLINKRYQLRFTLFMVGLSALLMVGLGIWVMRVANETTAVSITSVRGEACPKLPVLGEAAAAPGAARPPAGEEDAAPLPSMRLDETPDGAAADSPVAAPGEPAPSEPAPSAADSKPGEPAGQAVPAGDRPAVAGQAAPAAATGDRPAAGEPAPAAATGNTPAAGAPAGIDPEPRHVQVKIDESSMTLTPTVPPDLADRIVAHWICELRQHATFDRLERGRMRILWAMIITGIALVIGLALYGIKMTHRVAGPLFKVGLYLSKMREGRFDKVYNLRKGDQLVDFYDHFKLAHGGVVAMQQADIAQLTAVIAAAEAAGAGQHPVVATLRAVLARKEKSIE